MKKLFYGIIISCALMLIPSGVLAANVAKVGETEYETFAEALTNVEEGGTITLIDNTTVPAAATIINKDLTIDLNGFDLSAVNKVLTIQGAEVNITGEGSIIETAPDYAPIYVRGSNNIEDTNYTVVTIGKDVTLEGWSGVFITIYNAENLLAYGVVININGSTINALNDSADKHGHGIYINGSINNTTNYPIININNGTNITSTGTGIYAAGYAKWEIKGTTITGVDSGIGIKAGILNVEDSTINATGENGVPVTPYGNGINPSGAAIQVESKADYAAKDIKIALKNTTIVSENSHAFYEYGDEDTSYLKELSLDNVTAVSEDFFDVFYVSNEFDLTNLVKTGKYSENISKYVPAGYKTVWDYIDEMYVVTKVTVPTGNKTISGTIIGTVTDSTMYLKQGGVIIKKINLDSNTYSIPNVAPGIYNLIIENNNIIITKIVEVKEENVIFDFTMPNYSSELVLGGIDTPNIMVNGLDEVTEAEDVILGVALIDINNEELITEEEEEGISDIKELAKGKDVLFFEFALWIGNATANISGIEFDPLEIIVPYDLSKNKNTVIYRYHNNEAKAFTKLNERPTEDYEDGTYYLDTENNLIYIYTNGFSLYSIGSDKTANPDTNDNILMYVGLGIAGLITTAVLLKKKQLFN